MPNPVLALRSITSNRPNPHKSASNESQAQCFTGASLVPHNQPIARPCLQTQRFAPTTSSRYRAASQRRARRRPQRRIRSTLPKTLRQIYPAYSTQHSWLKHAKSTPSTAPLLRHLGSLKNKKAARTATFLRLAIAASSLIADFSVKTLKISH